MGQNPTSPKVADVFSFADCDGAASTVRNPTGSWTGFGLDALKWDGVGTTDEGITHIPPIPLLLALPAETVWGLLR